MTNEEKLNKIQRIYAGELKQFIEDAQLYVRYREGHDVKETYDEVMERGKRAYTALQKFYEVIDKKPESSRNRMIDRIAEFY